MDSSERRRISMRLLLAGILLILVVGGVGCVAARTPQYVNPGESIQAAVTAASPGETIMVNNGIYTENVDINKPLTLRSANGFENCSIQAADQNESVFEVTADSVEIRGFTITNATGYQKAGIHIRSDVNHSTIADNTIVDNYNGIMLYQAHNNTITGNDINTNNWIGILLNGSSNNNISDNSVRENGYSGINIFNSTCNTIAGNTATNNMGSGIFLELSHNNDLMGNTVSDNNFGIYVSSACNHNNLTANTAHANNYDGIYLDASCNNSLTGNTASANSEYGIYLAYSCNNTLAGNTASNNADYGIYLAYSCSNNLTGNTASGHDYGIHLAYSSNTNNLTGNTATNNYDGIVLYLSYYNNLTGNTAHTNSGHGIYLYTSCHNTVVNNTAYSNNKHGFYLRESSNYNNLTGNTAHANSDHGMYLRISSNHNILTGNIASNNSGYGMFLNASSNNHIYNNYFDNALNTYDGSSNRWNTTKTPGTNIIGGFWLGGNYWNDYSGNDTDGDGLGNTVLPYNASGRIVFGGDWLPLVAPAYASFDTGTGTYPSIAGTHRGTITMAHTITVLEIVTYACSRTSGHTEYAALSFSNGTIIAEAWWNGYTGDLQNLTFNNSFTLDANETYNYTIRTGSYPQIIHEHEHHAPGGKITCTEFVDVNGKRYEDWIPAIRLQ